MSEATQRQSNAGPGAEPKSPGVVRKVVLFGFLGIMIVALAYDYRVARPAVNEAYDKIATESTKLNGVAGSFFSNTDVQKLLDKEPVKTFNDGSDYVEVFAWSGGIPGRPHKLWAVFKQQNDNKMFYRHSKFVFESRGSVAPIADPTVLNYTDDEIDAIGDDEMAMGGGAENGPEGGAAGRGGFDPAAMFEERDADGDGKLSGDEIPERMAQSLAEIDTDGDGAVSKAEMEARMAARAAAGGGGRGGGRPGGGRGRGRGEIDRQSLGVAWIGDATPQEFVNKYDKNKDGRVTDDEAADQSMDAYEQIDENADWILTVEEVTAFKSKVAAADSGGRPAMEE